MNSSTVFLHPLDWTRLGVFTVADRQTDGWSWELGSARGTFGQDYQVLVPAVGQGGREHSTTAGGKYRSVEPA